MNAVFDFLRAALPWIAVGLLLAMLFARGAKKKMKESKAGDYGTEGMCLGMCLGISLGMLIGLAIGTCIKKGEWGEDNGEQ